MQEQVPDQTVIIPGRRVEATVCYIMELGEGVSSSYMELTFLDALYFNDKACWR